MSVDILKRHPFVIVLSVLVVLIVGLSRSPRYVEQLTHTSVAWLDSACLMQVWVDHVPEPKQRTLMLDTRVLSFGDTAASTSTNGRLRVYVRSDSLARTISQGDILLIAATPRRPIDDVSGFDYGRYLQYKGIAGQCFVDSTFWYKLGHRTVHSPHAFAERCRLFLLHRLSGIGLSERNESIVAALTLGYRESLDDETQQTFSVAGAMHVLAVSGLHVGIINLVLLFLFFGRHKPKILYRRKWHYVASALVVSALWFYALLTGFSPSVVRASLMCSLATFNLALHRPSSSVNIVAAAASLSLIFNPMALFSVSFLLSYSAVFSLVTIGKWLAGWFTIPNKVLKYFYDIVCMSVAAQLGTLPWTLYFFSTTSNWFLLTNLIVIPAAMLLVCLALFVLLTASIPYLGLLAGRLLDWVVDSLMFFLRFVEHLPYSSTHCHFTLPMTMLMFVAIAFSFMFVRDGKRVLIVPVMVCLALIAVFFYNSEYSRLYRDELAVTTHVQHLTGERVDTVGADTCAAFSWSGKRYVSVWGEQFYGMTTASALRVDYLVVNAIGRTQPQDLLECFNPDTVVLSQALSRRKADMIIKQCEQHQLPYINTRQKSFVRKYN